MRSDNGITFQCGRIWSNDSDGRRHIARTHRFDCVTSQIVIDHSILPRVRVVLCVLAVSGECAQRSSASMCIKEDFV